MAKHVIKFKSTDPKHGAMQIRIFDGPFDTIGIDYVGQPTSPSGKNWILTTACTKICAQFEYQINKQILQNELCLMMYPCNASFQESDQGGEWLNAVLGQLTKPLSIEHTVTTS